MGTLRNLGEAISQWNNPFCDPRTRRAVLFAIVAIGALLRVTMCFVGYPHQLHADEMNVIEPAVEMIERGSYLSYVYFHPDHFQIKICAFLFNAYSLLRYGADAAAVGAIPAFYVIARLVTAVCGIAMIPVAHCLLERIKRGTGVFAAFSVAFFPAYITHSGYASPDVPLSLVILVLIYLGVRHLERGGIGTVVAMGVATAIGMTTKYPAAICCFYVAGIIVVEGFRTRSAKEIALRILLVAAVAFVCLFAISPNLVTDLPSVLASLRNEARTVHLGADGLGFFGNLWFYATGLFSIPDATYNDTPYTSLESIVFLAAGIALLARRKARYLIPFSLCLLLWVCLSVFGLHWLRWGLPMYAGPLVLMGLGLYAAVAASATLLGRTPAAPDGARRSRGGLFAFAGIAIALLAAVFSLNALASSVALAKSAVVPQTRVEALAYCEENGITPQNSAFDGYTPFNLRLAGSAADSFADAASLETAENEGIDYIVISSYMYERYDPSNPDHMDAIRFYSTVRSECELVGEWKATEIEQTPFGLVNLMAKIGYLAAPANECLAGPDIAIYRISE